MWMFPLFLSLSRCAFSVTPGLRCALTSWGKQQPCGSVVTSRRGDGEEVARRRQKGNSLYRWVGSEAGDRGHTCCLTDTHTHTHKFLIHSETQPLSPPPTSPSLPVKHTLLLSWFYLFCCSFLETWPEAKMQLAGQQVKIKVQWTTYLRTSQPLQRVESKIPNWKTFFTAALSNWSFLIHFSLSDYCDFH